MKALLLAILSLALLTSACKKGKNANDLVGTWKLTETHRIGMIDWDKVSAAEEVVLIFNNDYTYKLIPSMISSVAACTGTYRIEPGNMLFMNSSCNLSPVYEEELMFARDGNTLILDYIMTSTGVKARYIKQ